MRESSRLKILASAVCIISFSSRALYSMDRVHRIIVDNLERTYHLHVPSFLHSSSSVPLVIVFHGGGGTARGIARETGWTLKADQERFLVVFPDGTRENMNKLARFSKNPQNWNDGSKRDLQAIERDVSDINFVRAIIDDVRSRFPVDERRIYATGFSNGAGMAFRVGREVPQVAAIAPVAGSDWLVDLIPKHTPSMLYITGTKDPLNPLGGGQIRIGRSSFGEKPDVVKMIEIWAGQHGCDRLGRLIMNVNGVKGLSYSSCSENAEVNFYTVEGLGHVWPGGKTFLPERIVGKKSDKLNATHLIWDFFKNHPAK